MRRTSSGSDLASSSLFAAPTSYVYMPPQKDSYKDSPDRALTVSLEIEMRTFCRGCVVIPRRNDPATGRAYAPYRAPCFTAEITGGLLIGTQCSLPCLPAQPIFHLPLGAITSVGATRGDARSAPEPLLLSLPAPRLPLHPQLSGILKSAVHAPP